MWLRCIVCKVMSRGVFSFFASQTAATIGTIRSFSSTFHMPFVLSNTAFNHTHFTQTPPSQSRAHGLHPDGQPHRPFELYITPYYARAIVNVIEHYNWKDFWYIYKSDEGDRSKLVVYWRIHCTNRKQIAQNENTIKFAQKTAEYCGSVASWFA